jgi:UDP-glucose 4-epimerase
MILQDETNEKFQGETVLVTGCAGFIGSNLVDELLSVGFKVIGVDNLSTGSIGNLDSALQNNRFSFVNLDLLEIESLAKLKVQNIKAVYHMAANADIRYGSLHPTKDFNQNVKVTLNLLEFCRINQVNTFIFASTGAIYGEQSIFPISENCIFPVQTSLYGASKVSAESFIQAYSESFGIKSIIFRFVSILGPRYSHGHVIDFYSQLRNDSSNLKVLGDGYQTKSYLHVKDCISALMLSMRLKISKSEVYNLGTDETCTVRDSIDTIIKYLNVNPDILFGKEKRGWIGDNPYIHLDISKMNAVGWFPKYSIKKSIQDTLEYLEKYASKDKAF